jgi:hypothetical protein
MSGLCNIRDKLKDNYRHNLEDQSKDNDMKLAILF